ncbi:fibulin-2-like protein, partial [Leptotrombidium deliense]
MLVNATNTCCHNGRFRRSTDVKPDAKEDNTLQRIIKRCGNKCKKGESCENIAGKYVCVDDLTGEEATHEEIVEDPPEMVDEDYGQPHETTDDNQENSLNNCAFGQKYNEETKKCEEDNVCDSLKNPCGEMMECEPVPGNFKCHIKKVNSTHCPDGYKMGNRYCEDINECEDQSKCAKPKVCNNYEGGYTCIDHNENDNSINDSKTPFVDINSIDENVDSCPNGYALNDEAECEDIDECSKQKHNCKQGTTCKNTDGSFICEQINCEAGKSMNSEGNCVASPIQKSCSPGYSFNSESNKCDDIDECETQKSSCKKNEECQNTPGSYKCVFSCAYGTKEMNGKCVDIDECKENTYDCPNDQVCVNKEDGYDCVRAPNVEKETSTAAIELASTASVSENTSPDMEANGLKRNTKCDEGFTFNVETGLCIDFRCDDGFQHNNETKLCEDIDE